MANETNGIYQWIAGGFAGLFVIVMGLLQRRQHSSLKTTKEDVRELYKRTNEHSTSIAVLKANVKAAHETLRRMDEKLDRLLEK